MAGVASRRKRERFAGRNSMDQRVRTVIAFMNDHLHEKITPAQLAREVRISPPRLRQIFKKATGMSVVPYLRKLRMEKAQRLFRDTLLSVKEVASSVGGGEVSHFVRDFKKVYGL